MGEEEIQPDPSSTSHKDYSFFLSLANNILANKTPTAQDLTNGSVHFLIPDSESSRRNHPRGFPIGLI